MRGKPSGEAQLNSLHFTAHTTNHCVYDFPVYGSPKQSPITYYKSAMLCSVRTPPFSVFEPWQAESSPRTAFLLRVFPSPILTCLNILIFKPSPQKPAGFSTSPPPLQLNALSLVVSHCSPSCLLFTALHPLPIPFQDSPFVFPLESTYFLAMQATVTWTE